MPDLIQSFQGRDIGFFRTVARLWGIDLTSSEPGTAQKELADALLNPATNHDIEKLLPTSSHPALLALIEASGKIPWAVFTRRFGALRDAGPGRRDREQIPLNPISAAEVLYYRGLLSRAFFDTPSGAQEFAYIPEDLAKVLSNLGGSLHAPAEIMGRPAKPKERDRPDPPCDRLLDDATTLLAALRMGQPDPVTRIPEGVIKEFLTAAGIITEGVPQIEPVRQFLEATRKIALEQLVQAWVGSSTFNELRQIPELVFEGEWTNDPFLTRGFLITQLEKIPENTWWNLNAFILAIKEIYPDFQRPAGDYDSWFIKRANDGTFLRGFDSWDEVEGTLIRYMVTGPLAWLGAVELAGSTEGRTITAFRIRSKITGKSDAKKIGARLSHAPGADKLHVTSQGKIMIPRVLSRAARYQVARFCEWDEDVPDEYRYRITTRSLEKAVAQGLKVSQLLNLLAKNSAADIPPAFVRSLKRWELKGTEARVESKTILRVDSPEILADLRKSKAGRFLGEVMGPVTVVVKPGAQARVLGALAELGLLAENAVDGNEN